MIVLNLLFGAFPQNTKSEDFWKPIIFLQLKEASNEPIPDKANDRFFMIDIHSNGFMQLAEIKVKGASRSWLERNQKNHHKDLMFSLLNYKWRNQISMRTTVLCITVYFLIRFQLPWLRSCAQRRQNRLFSTIETKQKCNRMYMYSFQFVIKTLRVESISKSWKNNSQKYWNFLKSAV